jgi:uncharacterized protein
VTSASRPSTAHERDARARLLGSRLGDRAEIVFACLHGSFADGSTYRDIDLALWLDPDRVPQDQWSRYAINLALQLEREVGERVDVRVLNRAPLAFRYHALRGRPLVVRDPEQFAEVRARTWDDYFDFAPFARQYLREALSE